MIANFTMIDPTRIFEINGQVCLLQSETPDNGLYTVGANRRVLDAVTAKRIRVMGWASQGLAGVTAWALRSASGGTFIMPSVTSPSNAAGSSDFRPIVASGYMETHTGEGLYVNVNTSDLILQLWYIVYTP